MNGPPFIANDSHSENSSFIRSKLSDFPHILHYFTLWRDKRNLVIRSDWLVKWIHEPTWAYRFTRSAFFCQLIPPGLIGSDSLAFSSNDFFCIPHKPLCSSWLKCVARERAVLARRRVKWCSNLAGQSKIITSVAVLLWYSLSGYVKLAL